jgi:hypothetical protein
VTKNNENGDLHQRLFINIRMIIVKFVTGNISITVTIIKNYIVHTCAKGKLKLPETQAVGAQDMMKNNKDSLHYDSP